MFIFFLTTLTSHSFIKVSQIFYTHTRRLEEVSEILQILHSKCISSVICESGAFCIMVLVPPRANTYIYTRAVDYICIRFGEQISCFCFELLLKVDHYITTTTTTTITNTRELCISCLLTTNRTSFIFMWIVAAVFLLGCIAITKDLLTLKIIRNKVMHFNF